MKIWIVCSSELFSLKWLLPVAYSGYFVFFLENIYEIHDYYPIQTTRWDQREDDYIL